MKDGLKSPAVYIGIVTLLLVAVIIGFIIFLKNANYQVRRGIITPYNIDDISDAVIRVTTDEIYLTNQFVSYGEIIGCSFSGEVIVLNDCQKLNGFLHGEIQKIIVVKTQTDRFAVFYYKDRQEVRTV